VYCNRLKLAKGYGKKKETMLTLFALTIICFCFGTGIAIARVIVNY
jgi:hypothetical protein